MKRSITLKLYHFLKNDGITVLISIFIFIFFILFYFSNKVGIHEIIDLTMFSSIIIAMILAYLSKSFNKFIINRLEDKVKLTEDYVGVLSKYKEDFYYFDNIKNGCTDKTYRTYFPITQYIELNNCEIIIHDSKKRYRLPNELIPYVDELFSAHDTSDIYNQLCIRVDKWELDQSNRIFHIYTSRTTYFNSLLTNRVMDFPLKNGLSVRDLLEFGPFLNDLSDSELSNHIGYNGFIISKDGYIPFVKRKNNLSIGKNKFGASINASLKSVKALEPSTKIFTIEGFVNAILFEIDSELKLPTDALESFSIQKNLIAAYRDLVEGGKPQFLFYLKSNWNREEIQDNFNVHQRKTEKSSLVDDGSFLLWIHITELTSLYLNIDSIIYRKKKYPMTHTAVANLGMFIEFVQNNF
ncbi:hypothetical protein [Faecalicoccus acidiformans]|uniref:hypothetical protein n=1 Tax=Faecalicoccus acidiformans TaxID=915173 RepID=UPI0023520CBB|nr:hypothetical protein [Faecalicoccus acidiformans]